MTTLCDGCLLDDRDIKHPICVPLPSDTVKGCIISRDPTSEFINPPQEYNEGDGNFQFNRAPPKWLSERIRSFMGSKISFSEMEKLNNFLNFQCYWTHFHKCPTSKTDKKYPRFTYHNGEKCANIWFNREVLKHGSNQKVVILLGKDLERYFQRNGQHQLLQNEQVIFLPHPSPINCGNGRSWNKNKLLTDPNRIEIENRVKKLLSLINE